MLTKSFNIIAILLVFLNLVLGQGYWPYGYGYNYGYNYGYGNGLQPYRGYYSPPQQSQLSQSQLPQSQQPQSQLPQNQTPSTKGQIPNFSQQQLQQIAMQISEANRQRSGRGLSQAQIYQLTGELAKIQNIGQQNMQLRERKILFDTGDSRDSILNNYSRSSVDVGDEGGKDDRIFGLSFITSLISNFLPIGGQIISKGLPILVEIITSGVPVISKLITSGIPVVGDIIKAFIGAFSGGD